MSESPLFLDERLDHAAQVFGARTAIVEGNGTRVSYAELQAQANAIAGWLATHGVGAGDRVGIVLPKAAAAVAAVFGVLRSGAAYVPVDDASPRGRARGILGDCEVKAAIISPERAALWSESGDRVHLLEVGSSAWEDLLASPPSPPEGVDRSEQDLAYLLYTSGSTGRPKGVMLSHANARAFIDWAGEALRATPDDRFSSHAPLHFDLSILDVFVSLTAGAELHLIDDAAGKNPRTLGAFLEERRITIWYSTPSVLVLLTAFGGLAERDASAMRAVLFAGEVFPTKHLRRLTELWPHVEFANLYGPTETNVCTAARIPLPVPEGREEPYPIGEVCAGYEAAVLDRPGGTPVAPGEEGLLHVAGPGLFLGYWKLEDATAARVFERDGQRWYDTGDVVREVTCEGFVFVGRRDRMVKRRGYRVELGEVESGLYRHSRVREAAVVAIADEDSGVLLRAHLVTEDARPLSILELKTFCASMLPASMVPDRFVFEESLPRTSTDKIDYQALLARS